MQCVNHSDRTAAGVCNYCAKDICAECLRVDQGENYCQACLDIKSGKNKIQARSPALAAVLSFIIGGLGQIYNGQIGKGLLIFFTYWLVIPWIIGIIDAYKTAVKINQGKIQIKAKPGCLIGAAVAMAALIVLTFFIIFIALLALAIVSKGK